MMAAVLVVLVLAGCSASATPGRDAAPTSADPCPQSNETQGNGTQGNETQGNGTQGNEAQWGCTQQARFDLASTMIAGQSGEIGIVVRDRVTGAVWRAGEPDLPLWAGSTPKLAFAVSLKEEEAAGRLTLDAARDAEIDAMLSVSDNEAADEMWDWYDDSASLMERWRTGYGMSSASYADGWPKRWGFVKCSSQDLVNLMTYVLDRANPSLRRFIVDRMRAVGPPQQWGVWGAGPDLGPGVKDGWSVEENEHGVPHWITATVGFVGPNERYVVAAMYEQPAGGDTIENGVHVLTDLVATVFGAPVPAPAEIPQD
jgi:hypothetical protein